MIARPLRTIVVVDDDPALLASLRDLFETRGCQVIVFAKPEEFRVATLPAPPACLVLGDADGRTVFLELEKNGHHLPTVCLTANTSVSTAVRAMREGADDYLTKPHDPEELLATLTRALENSTKNYHSAVDADRMMERAANLTRRERMIVSLVVAGHLNKQIASRLDLALVTVKVHRGRAMRKLGARNPAELARIAIAVGISAD